jgi:hypothetical protein
MEFLERKEFYQRVTLICFAVHSIQCF